MLDNSYGSIVFSCNKKKMSLESYGSFRVEFLNDKRGKLLENDELLRFLYVNSCARKYDI